MRPGKAQSYPVSHAKSLEVDGNHFWLGFDRGVQHA
jgi:hypothetical protein